MNALRRMLYKIVMLPLDRVDAEIGRHFVYDGTLAPDEPLSETARELANRRCSIVEKITKLGFYDPWPTVTRPLTPAQYAARQRERSAFNRADDLEETLRGVREALGPHDRPFIDDAIHKLRAALLQAQQIAQGYKAAYARLAEIARAHGIEDIPIEADDLLGLIDVWRDERSERLAEQLMAAEERIEELEGRARPVHTQDSRRFLENTREAMGKLQNQ